MPPGLREGHSPLSPSLTDIQTFFLCPPEQAPDANLKGRFHMTRFLPPSPQLSHVKNEAKALLKAHAQRDPNVLPVLRHMHDLASLDDEAIFALPIKLSQMQFALAMDYGFINWHALRKAIASVNPVDGFTKGIQGKATMLPDPPAGYPHANRLVAGVTMMLDYAGVMGDIVDMAGDTGMAFILQADELLHPFGNNLKQLDMGYWPLDGWGLWARLDFINSIYGCKLIHLVGDYKTYEKDPAAYYSKQYRPTIRQALDQHLPVLADCCVDVVLVTGMDEGEPDLLGQLTCVAENKIQRISQYPWYITYMDGTCPTITRHQADKQALIYAIALGCDQVDLSHLPGKLSGSKAWRLWQDQLKEPELAGPHYYSANVRGHLIKNRNSAIAYLKQMASRHDASLHDVFDTAINDYQAIVNLLEQTDTSKDGFEKGDGRINLVKQIDQLIHLESQAHQHLQDIVDMM